MRSEQNAALAALDLPMQDFSVMNTHVEMAEFAFEEINPVENGSSKTMEMTKHMPPAAAPSPEAIQVIAGCSPGCISSDHEIESDRIQQQPAHPAANMGSNPAAYPQQRRCAPLRQLGPTRLMQRFSFQ